MKPIKLSESEKQNILKLHGSNILVEQSTNKTIADIQTLVGTTPDNKLGPMTLAAIKTKLGQPDKSSVPTIDGYTYEQMKEIGWTDEQLAKSKFKSLIPTTTTTSSEQNKTELTPDSEQIKPIEMPSIKVKGISTAPTDSGYKVDTERVVDTSTF